MKIVKWICRALCVVMSLAAAAALVLMLYTIVENPGSGGFIDLDNLVVYFCLGGIVVFGGIAALTGFFGWKYAKKQ